MKNGCSKRFDCKEQLLEDKILQQSLHSGRREQLSLFDSAELEAIDAPETILHEEVLRRLRDDEFRAKVRKVAPGRNLASLEMEWLVWAQFKPDFPPKNPQKAFLGFCRRKGGAARDED